MFPAWVVVTTMLDGESTLRATISLWKNMESREASLYGINEDVAERWSEIEYKAPKFEPKIQGQNYKIHNRRTFPSHHSQMQIATRSTKTLSTWMNTLLVSLRLPKTRRREKVYVSWILSVHSQRWKEKRWFADFPKTDNPSFCFFGSVGEWMYAACIHWVSVSPHSTFQC